ncbi:hypothetical protein NC652_001301 [Populus alba x Populus x berolinensis]|nr:hypothetical protein NC652_001301 [Populus alba x Populus x berolinensis]
MPKRDVRRRVPANGGRKIRPPHPSPSPSPSPSRPTPSPWRSVKHSKPVKFLKRWSSEPMMKQRSSILLYESDGGRGGVLFRPHTCTDVLASSPSLIVPTNLSPHSSLDQLMALADLEFDYINPYDSSSRINKVILPEYITEGVLSLFFLITGHWCMSLLCIPYLYYNVRLIILCPHLKIVVYLSMGESYTQRQHLVDVTEIFNMLNWEKKQRLFKLGYLIVLLFLSIFWMILTALEDSDYD